MPSFRARVLDALDIQKKTVKLQVNETFPKIYDETGTTGSALVGNTSATTRATGVPYAISKKLISTTIGPNMGGEGGSVTQDLDVLGFVVGKPVAETTYNSSEYDNMYPLTTTYNSSSSTAASSTADGNSRVGHVGGQDATYTGFHYLNGLYDSESHELQSMRKSALPLNDLDSMTTATGLAEHSHKDWPDNAIDQHHLLNENPYADSLYYHSMRLSFLLTGITIPGYSEKASNHRGMVRMLILRPRLPSVKMRWDGENNRPHINMGYPPHWDTELFYSGTRTLGGRMKKSILTNSSTAGSNTYDDYGDLTHVTPSFGLLKYNPSLPDIDNDVTSLHYGHAKTQDGTSHDLTSYDILTAPINRDKYAVVVDKMVTLDTLHHGVASKRIENVVIPFNKRIKFPGRQQDENSTNESGEQYKLKDTTIDEPLNMQSRPIIMFLSMDQKISCQVTGYTTITET